MPKRHKNHSIERISDQRRIKTYMVGPFPNSFGSTHHLYPFVATYRSVSIVYPNVPLVSGKRVKSDRLVLEGASTLYIDSQTFYINICEHSLNKTCNTFIKYYENKKSSL